MDSEYLKQFLKNHHIKPNFTYGQNFLLDDIVLQDIADGAHIASDTAVVEVGPGIGNLTRHLCARAPFVLSIEKDPQFLPILKSVKKDFPKNFRFENADILEYDFQKFLAEQGYKKYVVVANIPYYITGKILRMFLGAKNKPECITVLTQKEVAQNIIAERGSLSIPAIAVQLFGEPKILAQIPARSFYPVPKVDSAVLQITPYKKTKYAVTDEKKLFRVIKACFSGKRKQLHNTLTNNLGLDKELVRETLEKLNIKPASRPQELSIDQWLALTEALQF